MKAVLIAFMILALICLFSEATIRPKLRFLKANKAGIRPNHNVKGPGQEVM